MAQLPNVLFVAAALDTEVTPEMPFDGEIHGAVSWFLAKAIGGAADADGDGRTTFAELQQYIGLTARQAVESRQTPSVNFLPGREAEVLPFAKAATKAMVAAPKEPPRLAVFLTDGEASLDAPGTVRATERAKADLIWDVARGEVVNNRQGDLVAQAASPPGAPPDLAWISGVVEKWRVLGALKAAVSGAPLALTIAPRGEGAAYSEGDAVTISVSKRSDDKLKYLTIVDLAADGTVQWLYPATASEAEGLGADATPSFPTRVRSPFGADHIIALATADEPNELRRAIKALDGVKAPRQLYDLILGHVTPGSYALGVAGLYTRSETP